MASHIANALQNARLYEEAQGKRELEILLDASKIFASSLNIQDILKKIARMGSKAIKADLAIVFLPSRGQEHPYHIDYYSTGQKARNVAQRIVEIAISGEEESKHGSLILGLSGLKPILIEDYADCPRRIQSLVGLIGSGIIVPLKLKDMLLGIFALLSLEQNAFSETDLSLATSLADLAAVAIENAQLYGYERNISETLQRSFLPTRLPQITDYEIAAYYRPAMAEAEIGGDFYDAFPSRGGDTGIIIADVSGKGLDAAVQTAMGKYMIRAYAAEESSPGSVLSRFNRTYYEYGPEGRFMTAFYGILDPENNILTYTGAGHDLPLLYSSASDSITQLATDGLCLGIVPETQYVDKQIRLQPGDVLLLYTDGATDIKGDSHRLEVSGLQRLFQSSVNMPAEQIIQNVFQGISDYGKGRFTDDIALVVLKRLKNT